MAFRVPILPHTSPLAPQPPSIKLPLHPHQLRALHRCLLVENDGSLAKDFGAKYDYRSRGGCLADAVGMGKTVSYIMKHVYRLPNSCH
jgi:SNF2 family DNA or RNA helicase